jgi:hypothetical protein
MMAIPALTLMAILTGIAVLHAYWGLKGRWPSKDEAGLAGMVVGKTPGGKMPHPVACFAVALAILAGVGLIALTSFVQTPEPWKGLSRIGYGIFAAVFIARGAAGYIPVIWRRSAGTAFVRLNTRYYSPLCLLLGAGLIANLAGR